MRDDHYWRSSFLWLALAACLPLLNVSVTWGKSPDGESKAKKVQEKDGKVKEVEVKPEAVVVEEADAVENAPAEENGELRLHASPNKYWLGVQIGDVSDELQEKLKLGKQEGVLIVNVLPQGPASKAGLKADDVVLSYDGKKLEGPAALVKLVASSKGEEVVLELMRDGERLEIKVRPEKRGNFQFGQPFPLGQKDGKGRLGLEQFDVPGLRLRMLPGWVDAGDIGEFPANTKISVARENDKPAIITVERGDEKWEVTEDKISELPKDVQPTVRRLMGVKPGRMKLHLGQGRGQSADSELEFDNLQLHLPEIDLERLRRLNDAGNLRDGVLGKGLFDQMLQELKHMRKDVDRLLEHSKSHRLQKAPPENEDSKEL